MKDETNLLIITTLYSGSYATISPFITAPVLSLAVIFDPMGYEIFFKTILAIPSVMASEDGELVTDGIFPLIFFGGVRLRLKNKMKTFFKTTFFKKI